MQFFLGLIIIFRIDKFFQITQYLFCLHKVKNMLYFLP